MCCKLEQMQKSSGYRYDKPITQHHNQDFIHKRFFVMHLKKHEKYFPLLITGEKKKKHQADILAVLN